MKFNKNLCISRACTYLFYRSKFFIEKNNYTTISVNAGSLTTDHLSSKFIPPHQEVNRSDIDALFHFVDDHNQLLVMTGAGISTESGIPDYRSEGVGLYATSKNRPVQYQDFVKSADIRQRYWARNFVGWPTFSSILPNNTHKILKNWEDTNKVDWIITQNVDALHTKAGSKKVTELHGCAHRVMCLHCDAKMTRPQLQDLIISHNPDWTVEQKVEMAPDGDVQLSKKQIDGFKVPACQSCGGVLKPEITFFGDNVPKSTVEKMFDKVKEADAVLVLGSSLEVYSGYRFVNYAHGLNIPVAIVTIGPTRADKLADLKLMAKCSTLLGEVNKML